MSATSYAERQGAVTFRGKPVTLIGKEPAVGSTAPDFTLYTNDLAPVTLDDTIAGGTRAALLIVVPSIDTSVCALETARFNRHMADLPTDKIAGFTISLDLPFAQKRFRSNEKVASLELLSAYRDPDFGPSYGVLIKELGLLARSVFLIDKDRTVRMATVVPEVAQEPDYDEILLSSRRTIGV